MDGCPAWSSTTSSALASLPYRREQHLLRLVLEDHAGDTDAHHVSSEESWAKVESRSMKSRSAGLERL